MSKYVAKPFCFEAIRIDDDNIDEIKNFVNHQDQVAEPLFDNISFPKKNPRLVMWLIHTLNGIIYARPGEWLIREINGECRPCRHELFLRSYQLIGE